MSSQPSRSLPPEVQAAIGLERARAFTGAVEDILGLADSVATWTRSFTLLPVTLDATEPAAATDEMVRRIGASGDDPWAFAVAVRGDGSRFGLASPFSSPTSEPDASWFTRFVLSEMHPRLTSWWLTEVWRASELAQQTLESLGRWNVVVAAACARSLLEGAAALFAAARDLEALWNQFKTAGPPDLLAVETFRSEFNRRTTKLQYQSRVDQDSRKDSELLSPNVLTLIGKLAKAMPGVPVQSTYEWLCDAVHPSYGSRSTYTVIRALHDSGTHLVEDYARAPLEYMARSNFAHEPTVAYAIVDATTTSATRLLDDFSRTRWMIDDFGLTTGVADDLTLVYDRAMSPSDAEQACPCGSGRSFAACVHRWGISATPV